MDRLRILVVDEHPIVSEGLESFLTDYPDLSIVATVSNIAACLEELQNQTIDIVLLELAVSDVDGSDVIQLILNAKPDIAVLIYSRLDTEASVYWALKMGARGYILKTSPLPELAQAIREVSRGEYVLSPSLNPAIIKFYLEHRDRGFDQFAEFQLLTDREQQVFRLLADGRQTRDIGEILCISPKTVAKHRASIKKKLSLKNEVEMAQYAQSIGILEVDRPISGTELALPKI